MISIVKYFYLSIILVLIGCEGLSPNIGGNSPEVEIPFNDVAWVDTEAEDETFLFEMYGTPSNLKYLTIHCTAEYPNSKWGPEDLKKFFKEQRGWSRPGYTFYITRDGNVHPIWPSDIDESVEYRHITNGAKGYNHESIHIAYQGGVDLKGNPKDTRTLEQKKSIRNLVRIVTNAVPTVIVQGHRDHKGVTKACPSFDVSSNL